MLTRRSLCKLMLMLSLVSAPKITSATAEVSALSTKEREMYRAIAHRIFNKLVSAVHDQYPDLSRLASGNGSTKQGMYREQSKDKLWESYHYIEGMTWIPNPKYNPGMKGS